jgi:hypothetical protein
MHRFDSEVELQSHELGRSLLCMLQDDDVGFGGLHRHPEHAVHTNPFDELRNRLAAVGMAIQNLHPQVHERAYYFCHMQRVS